MSLLLPVHILTYSYTFGATSFHSFVSSIKAFKVLPRKEFGLLQSHLFPIHFLTQAIGPIAVGLTAPYAVPLAGATLLGVSSASGLVNYLWLLPVVQRIKEQRTALTETFASEAEANASPEVKELTKKFGKYHGLSLLFNLASVLTIAAYGYVLSTQFSLKTLVK